MPDRRELTLPDRSGMSVLGSNLFPVIKDAILRTGVELMGLVVEGFW